MEPIKTEQTGNPGRPRISDEQYQSWLKEIRPYLEQFGCSLLRACVKAGLEDKYYSCILEKYNAKDWFSKRVDAFRTSFGDNINEAMARLTNKVLDKVKTDTTITSDELGVLKHMSQYHRTAQPFFANRQENATPNADEVGKVLDDIESENIDDVGTKANEQVVAAQQSLQDKGQTG